MPPLRIAGLDLSLASTGYAAPDGATCAIKCGKRRGPERLDYLVNTIGEALLESAPTLVAVEGYAFGVNDSATRSIAELHGVVKLLMWRWGLTVVSVNPMSLKMYALGRAGKKEQMLAEAVSRFGLRFTTNDECDAYWLRQMALDHYGQAIVQMPAKNRGYLDKVEWPDV